MSTQNYHRNSNTKLLSSTDIPGVCSRRRCGRLRVSQSLLETKYKERDSSTVESVIVKKFLCSSVNFKGDKLAQKLGNTSSALIYLRDVSG